MHTQSNKCLKRILLTVKNPTPICAPFGSKSYTFLSCVLCVTSCSCPYKSTLDTVSILNPQLQHPLDKGHCFHFHTRTHTHSHTHTMAHTHTHTLTDTMPGRAATLAICFMPGRKPPNPRLLQDCFSSSNISFSSRSLT